MKTRVVKLPRGPDPTKLSTRQLIKDIKVARAAIPNAVIHVRVYSASAANRAVNAGADVAYTLKLVRKRKSKVT